jgi:putative sigma-54 modulation protein
MLQLQVRGENVEVTQALYEYVQRKLQKLERYFEQPLSNVRVNLKVYKVGQKVEVTIPVMGITLRAEDINVDLYAAIDVVVDKLERQIRKHKTKVNRKLRHQKVERVENTFNTDEEPEYEYSDFEGNHEVVRTKTFALKPMDVEEAILQMEMLGHQFFVFNDAATNRVSVVYERKDGRYGLIETE